MAVLPRPTAENRFGDARAQELARLIEPTVIAHQLYLEELELKGSGSGTVLRVVVDCETGTQRVDLDALAGLSEALSVVLDSHEKNDDAAAAPLAALDSYQLEVTTPGATRPLTEPRHFRRNLGRLLEIERAQEPPLTARLKEVLDDGVVVAEIQPAPKKGMKPKTGPDTHIQYGSIARARVQVEFSHTEQ